MDIAFVACLMVFTLALDALALQRFFGLTWARAAGISALINVVSFIIATIVMGMLVQRYEIVLTNLYYLSTYFALILALHSMVMLALRTTVEVLIARYWLRDAVLTKLALVLLAANLVSALPGVVTQAQLGRPRVPAGYQLEAAAQGFAAGDGVLVYAALEQHGVVARDLAGGGMLLLNSALPYHGYRVAALTTNTLVLGVTNTVTLARYAGITNHVPQEFVMTCAQSNPACVAVAPDLQRLAYVDGGMVRVCDVKTGGEIAHMTVPADVTPTFLGWARDGAALVCSAGSQRWQYELDAATSAWQRADTAPVEPAWTWTPALYQKYTNTFGAAGMTATVYTARGIEISMNGVTDVIAPLPQAAYFGIGFAPHSGIFLAQCNREIIAIDVRRKTIAHVARGLCALLTCAAERLP